MTIDNTLTSSIVRAKDVIDVSVKNNADEDLGSIKDIVLDKKSGQVRYVVLSFGGWLGLGNKLFALPWNAIHYDNDDDCFILNVEKEKIKNAPGFDDANWPDMADRKWETKIFDHYGTKPYWDETNRTQGGTETNDSTSSNKKW
jgi:sporulation protein YlmC with PRC-barrel domain